MEPIIVIDNKQLSGQPGLPVIVGLRIKNTGNRNTAYDLSVVGIPESWATITPTQVRPAERQAETATATLTITPPTGADAPAGPVAFGVMARATVDGSSAVDEATLNIGGQGGLDVIAGVTQRSGRWSAKFPVVLHNTGNDETRVALVPFDPTDETALSVDREIVTLAPRATTNVEVKAKLRSPTLRGANKVHPISLAIYSHQRGADMKRPGQPVVPGSDPLHRNVPLIVTQSPILSKGVMGLGALLVVGLIALLGYRNFLYRDFDPEVLAPTQGPTVEYEILPGAISLRWGPVSGAETYQVDVQSTEGQATEELTNGSMSYVLGGLSPSVEYTINVFAVTGTQRSASTEFVARPERARLESPTKPEVAPTDVAGQYVVSWTFDSEDAVEYDVRVDGEKVKTGLSSLTTTIPLAPGKHQIYIEAVAVDDPTNTGPSDPTDIDVPAPEPVAPVEGGGDQASGGSTDEEGGAAGGGNEEGGTSPSTDPAATATILQESPFVVLLQSDFAGAAGGLDGSNAATKANLLQASLLPYLNGKSVLAIPSASYDAELKGVATPDGGEGWIVGVPFSTEAEAFAFCANPDLVNDPNLELIGQDLANCLVLKLTLKS